MREFVFILIVIGVLLALTALRYRKQIVGIIGVARALRDASARDLSRNGRSDRVEAVRLVNCMKCGNWVPEDRARSIGGSMVCTKCRP